MRKSSSAVLVGAALVAMLIWTAIQALPRGTASSARASEATEDSYSLSFGDSFVPQLASRDDLGISVVLAVDVSGSMSEPPASGGRPKYIQAAQAFSQVVDVLERLVRDSPKGQILKVGVLKFNADVIPVMPITELDANGLQRLRAFVLDPGTFAPDGSTAIGDALAKGVEWVSQSGTILRSVIVVTDGENKTGAEPSWVLSAVYNSRNDANTQEHPVMTGSTLTTFIGFDVNAGQFQPLEKYGARVTAAADQAQLASVLSNLLEADITKLEAPSLGRSGSASE